MPLLNNLYRISNLFHRIKTQWFYKPQFGKIGPGSLIRHPIQVWNPQWIYIGSFCGIRDGARLEVLNPTGATVPRLEFGDNTTIQQNFHIVCRQSIRIGKDVTIAANCTVVDTEHPYLDIDDPCKVGARISDGESFVEIGDGSFLGVGTVVMPNVRIGKYVIVGANSVVNRDLPDYTVCVGAPARVVKRYDPSTKTWLSVKGG